MSMGLTQGQIERLAEIVFSLDLTKLVNSVREIARQYPGITYRGDIVGLDDRPTYVTRDEQGNLVGSCILGRGLIHLGLNQVDISLFDESDDTDIKSLFYLAYRTEGETIPLDNRLNWLATVQHAQDNVSELRTWSECILLADRLTGL